MLVTFFPFPVNASVNGHAKTKRVGQLLLIAASVLLSACFSAEPTASWTTTVQGIYSAGFSLDGKFALVGSIQHGGSLWRTADAERLYNWNHEAGVATAISAMAFSPDGSHAVTADERTLVLWDVEQGTALRYFNAPGAILYIKLTPGAEKALLGMRDGVAVLFDIQKGGIVHELEQRGNILSLAVSGNGRYALFGLDDKKARYWDLGSGKLLRDITTKGRVKTVALSHDGSLAFVSGGQDEAGIWDMRSGALKSELDYSNPVFPTFSSFLSARFYQDGTRLLTGNSTGALEYWNVLDGERMERWIAPTQNRWRPTNFSVLAVALRAADQQVLAMTSNGMVYQFEYALD